MYQVAPHPIRRNFSSAGAFTAPANWPSAALHEPLLMLADLESRLRSSGGLLNADCLVGVLHGRVSQPISHVARMVVSRQLVHLTFARTIWLPAFQFNPGFDTLREGISEVLRELTPVLDDLELANWFAQPNIELDYLLPAEVLPLYPDEVRQAARLYRFVVKAS